MSLRRIGWDMRSMVVFLDDMGREVSCTQLSPALFKVLLHQAVLRQLERQAYGKLVEGGIFCGVGVSPPMPAFSLEAPAVELAPDRPPPDLDGSNRLCFDVVAAGLRSKKLSAWEKGSARALACNALWTNSRALRCGYRVCPLCPLCQSKVDSVFHRLWECEVCQDERVELVGMEMVLWAREACESNSPDLINFLTGMFAHPGDYVPLPISQ